MEGSVDQLNTRHSKYGLQNGHQETQEEDPLQNGAADGDSAEGRKHMSAYERRLQKKKVPLQNQLECSFYYSVCTTFIICSISPRCGPASAWGCVCFPQVSVLCSNYWYFASTSQVARRLPGIAL